MREDIHYTCDVSSAGTYPIPSSIHHLSNDDCPEDKRKDYQNCSVLCCVQQLGSDTHTRMSSSQRSLMA